MHKRPDTLRIRRNCIFQNFAPGSGKYRTNSRRFIGGHHGRIKDVVWNNMKEKFRRKAENEKLQDQIDSLMEEIPKNNSRDAGSLLGQPIVSACAGSNWVMLILKNGDRRLLCW